MEFPCSSAQHRFPCQCTRHEGVTFVTTEAPIFTETHEFGGCDVGLFLVVLGFELGAWL
jgi:hypothetical protein